MLINNLDYYIDCSLDTFVDECRDMTFMDLLNLKKSFELQYTSVNYIKDLIVRGIKEKMFSDVEEAKRNLKNLYEVLFVIEERAKIIEEFKKSMGSI